MSSSSDLHQLVVALDEHETVAAVDILLHQHREPLEGFVGGLEEVIVGDGLQQVVEGIHLIAFDGILREGGGKDHLRLLGQDLGELNAAELWHLDVEEQQLYGVFAEVLHGRDGTVVGSCEIEVRCLTGVALQQSCCQRLIVDDGTCNGHNSIFNVDKYVLPSSETPWVHS